MSNPPGETQLDLCPLDERRMPTEMYVKLFVVYFTTIGAYAHLLHIRREPRGIRSYLLMIAAPITGSAFIVLPVLGLAIQALISRGDYETLKLSIGILIGQLPRDGYRSIEDSNRALAAETQQHSSLEGAPNSEGRRDASPQEATHADGQQDNFLDETPRVEAQHDDHCEEPSKLSLKFLGRVLFQLAILAQCITSIYLFARRVRHGSDALYDYRILQLALLGLSVSAVSAIQLIWEPRYPYPDSGREYATKLRWLFFLRPLLVEELREADRSLWRSDTDLNKKEIAVRAHRGADEVKKISEGPLLLLDWTYMITASLLYRALCPEYSGISTPQEESTHTWFWHYYIYIFSFFIFLAYVSHKKHLFWLPVGSILLLNTFFGFIIAALSGWQWLFVLTESPSAPTRHAAYLVTLLTKDNNTASYGNWTYCDQTPYGPDWSHIPTYGAAPTFCPCPKAWSDPAANSVWWLA